MAKRESYGGCLVVPQEYFGMSGDYWKDRIARLKADCVFQLAKDLPEGRKFVVEIQKDERVRCDYGRPVKEIRVRANLMEVDRMEIREFAHSEIDMRVRPMESVELPKPKPVTARIADYFKWMCREVEYDGPRG